MSLALSRVVLAALWVYRKTVSPWMPPCCRFTPTCSAYAVEAVTVHGPYKGSALAAWRLLRCQPFCKGGYDPVPGSINNKSAADDRESLSGNPDKACSK